MAAAGVPPGLVELALFAATVRSDHRLKSIGTCGTYLNTAAGFSTTDLFDALRTSEELRFKVRLNRSADTLPMLGIIALKHTHHFVRHAARRRRP